MSDDQYYSTTKVNRVVSRELQGATKVNDYNFSPESQVGHPPNKLVETSDIQQDVMSTNPSDHSEAYYLYFIATVGIALNIVVILAIIVRRPLRKMTSGFLIHACLLDLFKSAYCIPIATNLLSQTKPVDCDFFGAMFVILVTTSVFNMVAMVCTEAYTFGEKNIGGNSKGTVICIMFGIILVYIGSIILHLGPTLIGGHFDFQPEIGSCSFTFGKQTGYVAHIMWVIISTVAMIAVFHFIYRLYKEIQINRPNRVSFLVRTSITVMDSSTSSTCRLRKIIRDATHRAKIFIYNAVLYIVCWYPYFLLIILDKNFTVSPKVYQAFAFIAWSQGPLQPIMYIFFDRNLNILAKHMYCDKYRYDIDTIIQMMMNRHRTSEQTDPRFQDRDASFSSSEPPNNLDAHRRPRNNVLNEHRNICMVQNTSNHNTQNLALNIPNMEPIDLTQQLVPCSNIPPASEGSEELPPPPLSLASPHGTPVSFHGAPAPPPNFQDTAGTHSGFHGNPRIIHERSRTPVTQMSDKNYENYNRDIAYTHNELTEVEF
ncbi:histamine H2 receptor-like [Mya arenaria]|uniref:histamine H2 receptor-like n=1 Tax=Mya arenaria TaxID=6604 RepID=UPI0022E0CEF5|nr:histamine H2 receptor-like [Mya arenaria]XP_052799965.1 histamine H2 receptor-like [Mya arenaria]